MNAFGEALEKGFNGKIDLIQAMKYYKMSADLENSDGMNSYGVGLENGYNGEIDLIQAMKYYKMSADLENSDGKVNYTRLSSFT
jgi:TPR repeat protein